MLLMPQLKLYMMIGSSDECHCNIGIAAFVSHSSSHM